MSLIQCYVYVFYFILFAIHHINGIFTPDIQDYDAYGLKMAMNEYFLVLAQNNNQPPTFFIQFAPYNDSEISSKCSLTYPNSSITFIYTVAIGKKQNQNEIHFFFAGEFINGQEGLFIGMATYNNTNQTSNISPSTSSSCDTDFSCSIQCINNSKHEEYYILGVDPKGRFAYGLTNKFIFVFDSKNNSVLNIWNGNLTWPDDSFIPHAVDISENFGVVAGFIENDPDAKVKYSPMIYLINFNLSNTHHLFVVDQYQPIASNGSWQDLLTNADAFVYSAKYDMSVSINEEGNILVGMQFINRVFLLSVNDIKKPIKLNNISRYTNGRSLGNGKSVAWLENGIAAILINVYSLNYEWLSSQIFLFDIYADGYNSTTVPLSVFPNRNQLIPTSFSKIFLNIISSSSSLALLDDKGKIIIFSSTQPGFYPSIQNTGSMPFITLPQACMAGTYKNKCGVQDCVLCPNGTKNPGNFSTHCDSCSPGSFCPLGSVDDVPRSTLEETFQVVPYPHSPESTIFDEILLHNMFTIGHDRCVLVSPLFWALIVAGIAVVIIVIMEMLKLFAKGPKYEKIRETIKRIFKHTDLLGEGEFWVGGLASFSIVVLVSFAYAFSNGYLKQYPIETSSDSYFACDLKMRNAKFETNLQTLAIQPADDEKEMFDLLNNQKFLLHIDFINTLINCDAISLQSQIGSDWSTIRYKVCDDSGSRLSLSIELMYQHMSVRIFIEDRKTIGGLRLGLSGEQHESESYTLKKLHFYESFWKDEHTLSQTLLVALALTKVINETEPMVGEESEFSGIYIPTFTVDMNSLFISDDQYVRSSLTLTTLTIVISETPYYVKNVQQPIARQSEIIFRNLLFTVVCLEIFGLLFVLYKLVLKPIYLTVMRKCRHGTEKKINKKKYDNNNVKYTNHLSKIDEINADYISSTF